MQCKKSTFHKMLLELSSSGYDKLKWLSMTLFIKGSHSDLPNNLSNYVFSPCSYFQSKIKFFNDFFNVCKWRKPGTLLFPRISSHFVSFLLLHRISQLPGIFSTTFTSAFTRLLGSTFHFFIIGMIKDILYASLHPVS